MTAAVPYFQNLRGQLLISLLAALIKPSIVLLMIHQNRGDPSPRKRLKFIVINHGDSAPGFRLWLWLWTWTWSWTWTSTWTWTWTICSMPPLQLLHSHYHLSRVESSGASNWSATCCCRNMAIKAGFQMEKK